MITFIYFLRSETRNRICVSSRTAISTYIAYWTCRATLYTFKPALPAKRTPAMSIDCDWIIMKIVNRTESIKATWHCQKPNVSLATWPLVPLPIWPAQLRPSRHHSPHHSLHHHRLHRRRHRGRSCYSPICTLNCGHSNAKTSKYLFRLISVISCCAARARVCRTRNYGDSPTTIRSSTVSVERQNRPTNVLVLWFAFILPKGCNHDRKEKNLLDLILFLFFCAIYIFSDEFAYKRWIT